MDNNSFGQPMGPNQPISNGYGPQGPMPGQPMPNGMPMGQPMGPNQPTSNGYGPQGPMPGQPMPNGMPMGQPYPQPMVKPPKQPMDPAKKKKLILGFSIGGVVLALGITAAILVPILLRIDYAPAYKLAKELGSSVYDIYQTYDCEDVIDYVESYYTSVKTYTEYVEGCKDELTRSDLVDQLENADGVKRNSDIQNQFNAFKTIYDSVIPNQDDLNKKLDAYQAYHGFIVAKDDVSYSSNDAEITAAANYLTNSNDETLKTYGEGWLEKYLAAAHAYQTWKNASKYFGEEYDAKNKADTELKNWISTNEPSIKTLYPLNLDNASKLYSEYNKLYDLISDTYEKNYNSDSGDCVEFLGEVVCD